MVNDSAGTDVILVDKSQRPAGAAGFKAAVAIEAERGLCNKPTFITSTDDFVKVFGNPSFDKYGQANLEAYFLAQNNVPLVVSRAKNPDFNPGDAVFGCMRIQIQNGGLYINGDANADKVTTPAEPDTACIYFKGEGNYCSRAVIGEKGSEKSNIVLRFSKPATQSAYADERRAFQLQVFDFAGHTHIDRDTAAILGLTPNLEPVLGGDGSGSGEDDALSLPGYIMRWEDSSIVDENSKVENSVVVFVNGIRGQAEYDGNSVYEAIVNAVHAVPNPDKPGEPLLPSFRSNGNGTFTIDAGEFNCFNLSISVAITATATCGREDGKDVTSRSFNYGCGSVTIVPDKDDKSIGTAVFTLSTGLYLENRDAYMFMGDENATWAAVYAPYLKESYIASLNYEDYDPSYVSMQLDTVLAGSNYLIGRTSESFGDYTINFPTDYDPDDPRKETESSAIVHDLQYFDKAHQLPSNMIMPGQRSYAYSLAVRAIMANNLTIWRCVVTPNLGDVMNTPDFLGVIEAAGETTLGVSNIGKAASLNAFENLGGRHGDRFIADFPQYGRRTVAGRRMWMTMAALVTLTLNDNYRNGNEARPPMGESYGRIQCDALSEVFTGPERKVLAQTYKLNPAIDEDGFYLWEETTSQKKDSSLSDTHVILSYCWMKYQIYESMRPFVAEYNDTPTVNEGLRVLKALNTTFQSRNYIEEGKPNADKNVLGDKVMRFDFPVRFKGVARYVDVYVTAYSQTQSLEISLAEEA